MSKKGCMAVLALVVAGPLLGLLASAVITYQMPKKYDSEAVVEVKPPSAGMEAPQMAASSSSQQFLATEFEKIKSRKSLEQVCRNLKLTERWMMEEQGAVDALKQLVTCQNIRGTDLISIRVRHTSAVDARDMVAELVKVYRDSRASADNRNREQSRMEMNKAVREQEDKVEERRKLLATIVRNKGIIYQGSGSPAVPLETGASGQGDESREKAIQHALDMQDYVDAKRDFETDQELLQQLKLKQISSRIASQIPSDTVILHEEPVISHAPVSPNVTLNLVLGTVAGLIFFPITGLLVMGVMKACRRA